MFTLKQLEERLKAGTIRGFGKSEKLKSPNKAKYGAKKTMVDGYTFDSQKEANRYIQLRYRLKAGEITDLELQKEFELEVNGEKVASYFADFVYRENGRLIVEDVKSTATQKIAVYRLKKKLMKSIYGIEIQET